MGGEELIVIVLIAVLLFGPSQLPKLARGLGEAMREFRKAQREGEAEADPGPSPARREVSPASLPERQQGD